MADGPHKDIENVVVGDKVVTYNVALKKTEVEEVLEVVSPIHRQFIVLSFNNGIVNTNTLDHPYYVVDKGWSSYNPKMTKTKYKLEVEQLAINDIILSYNNLKDKVEEVKLIDLDLLDQTQQTYNLHKVGKNHNFFANGILVHNKAGNSK